MHIQLNRRRTILSFTFCFKRDIEQIETSKNRLYLNIDIDLVSMQVSSVYICWNDVISYIFV